jgi:kynurenine formamidase
VRAAAAADPDHGVGVADLRRWEAAHGRIPAGAAVILWTGWAARWGTPAYANLDPAGVPRQPGFTLAAVEWLIETGRLGRRGALGTDTFSPDRGVDTAFAVSLALLREHRISLECLANLAALPTTGAWVLAASPIHRGGTGATATVYALLARRASLG